MKCITLLWRLHGAIHLGCWAHARRSFVEAEAVIPKTARRPEQLVTQFIAAIGELYAIEAKTKELSKPVLIKIEGLLVLHLHAVSPRQFAGQGLALSLVAMAETDSLC